MFNEMMVAGGGGGSKGVTGTVTFTSSGQSQTVQTGLSQVKIFRLTSPNSSDNTMRFIDYDSERTYNKQFIGIVISTGTGYGLSGTGSSATGMASANQYASAVSAISGGDVTIKSGTYGSWGIYTGEWYAE